MKARVSRCFCKHFVPVWIYYPYNQPTSPSPRTSYLISGAWCKIRVWGTLFRITKGPGQHQQDINPSAGPSWARAFVGLCGLQGCLRDQHSFIKNCFMKATGSPACRLTIPQLLHVPLPKEIVVVV